MMAGAGADLFNRTCFNYPTLGDLYKYATYATILNATGWSWTIVNRDKSATS